jgi:DNA polymerase-1
MKYYLVELDKRLQAKYTSGIDYEFIGNIHDEVQMEVSTDLVADISKIAEESFAGVEEHLKFRVKLEGEAQHGRTWNDTH